MSKENTKQEDYNDLLRRIETLEAKNEQNPQTEDQISLFVFSGDWDKVYSAFVVGTGAAAAGTKVRMFFTFWASAALRNPKIHKKNKTTIEKMFGCLIPNGLKKLALSKCHFAGLGHKMMNLNMKQKGISSLEELFEAAKDLDIEINICEMSMNIIGLHRDELIDYPNLRFCGVQEFLENAAKGHTTLYI